MRFPSKYSGQCPHCGSGYAEGDQIEYRKDCRPICVACANEGKVPPPNVPTPAAPVLAAPAAAPAKPAAVAPIAPPGLLAEAKETNALLRQILAALSPAPPPAEF